MNDSKRLTIKIVQVNEKIEVMFWSGVWHYADTVSGKRLHAGDSVIISVDERR